MLSVRAARTVRPLHIRLIWTASGGADPSSMRTSPETITTTSVCPQTGATTARDVRQVNSARTKWRAGKSMKDVSRIRRRARERSAGSSRWTDAIAPTTLTPALCKNNFTRVRRPSVSKIAAPGIGCAGNTNASVARRFDSRLLLFLRAAVLKDLGAAVAQVVGIIFEAGVSRVRRVADLVGMLAESVRQGFAFDL